MDATHKTSDSEMPLYAINLIIKAIDGNGESEVASAFLTQTEDFRQMEQIFKSKNSK